MPDAAPPRFAGTAERFNTRYPETPWNIMQLPDQMENKKRNYIIYTLMLVVFGILMVVVAHMGSVYDADTTPAVLFAPTTSAVEMFGQGVLSSFHHPLAMLLLQIIAILIAVRIFSYLFKFLGQPGVIGEIGAGIVLGPSVLGYFFPEVFGFLFAPASLVPLGIISQLGLILFMFVIGLELDLGIIKNKASETFVISHASIIVPFFLGMAFAYYIYPEFGEGNASFLPFALFIGIAVSITAFPVLARIVQERGLSHTPMGMLAIASAANNDVTAWCILAAVIAIAKAGTVASALYTIFFAVIYVLVMFGAVRPFMKRVGDMYNTQEGINKTLMALVFIVLIISSYITEMLGIHALFGAFVAGVIMPANINFRRIVTQRIEDVALVLLLPLFFVFTGLRTEIGLINTPHLWAVCGIMILVSICGKMLGATFSARFVGESWKDSLSIGVLMNTRGLMELIVLNIGFEMGIIPSPIYVMFVIMALFTTFMATPSLALIEKVFKPRRKRKPRVRESEIRILISFANPDGAPHLLRLAGRLYGNPAYTMKITAVHFTIGTETNPMQAESYASDCFTPLLTEADKMGVRVETRYLVTDHYAEDLEHITREGSFDFVMTGVGPNFVDSYVTRGQRRKPLDIRRITDNLNVLRNFRIFSTGITRDKTETLIGGIDSNLVMSVNRGTKDVFTAGIILTENRDETLMNFVRTLAPGIRVDIMALTRSLASELKEEVSKMTERGRDPAGSVRRIYGPQKSIAGFAEGKELLILSYNSWLHISRNEPLTVAELPSFVIVRPHDYRLNEKMQPSR